MKKKLTRDDMLEMKKGQKNQDLHVTRHSSNDVFDRTSFREALLTKRVVKMKVGVREAAIEIGISSATLSRCENGKAPDVYTYFYCCRWLGVPMQTFFMSCQMATYRFGALCLCLNLKNRCSKYILN